MNTKDLEKRFKKAFGLRFQSLRCFKDNEYYLYLHGSRFDTIDLNNIIQIGFANHIGFVNVEFIGQLDKCLRVHLRAY